MIAPLQACAGFRRFFTLFALALAGPMEPAVGAGVTVITHGFNGNVTDWIIPMTERVAGHPSFRGTSVSCYKIAITQNGSGQYVAAATFLGGSAPTLADSGEILVKLDWSTLAVTGPSSTTIANAAVGALLSSSLIPEMGGRPLAELPLHLIGHSRGGSVVTEMARLIGVQGVWVDHVTTLDPVPVSTYGDADVFTYSNVLFADNYWQTIGGFLVPTGKAVPGAYNRKLLSLSGGYSSAHSDVHLWYHGTIELSTPATDTGATINTTERSTWWTSTETAGAAAGFRYSLIGRGDRLSSIEPAGAGNGRINDGFNKLWDLGGGVAANRTALPANSGLWPNVIRLVLANADPVSAGETFSATLYHQSGATVGGSVNVRILLDADFNPYNGNEIEIDQRLLGNTGTSMIGLNVLELGTDPATVAPGLYAVCAQITDGIRTRHLYASEMLQVTPSSRQPAIDAASLALTNGVMRFNVLASPGQNVVVKATTNFVDWDPLETHSFTSTTWEFIDADAGMFPRRFYKAFLLP
jgi:hypothetical protein